MYKDASVNGHFKQDDWDEPNVSYRKTWPHIYEQIKMYYNCE